MKKLSDRLQALIADGEIPLSDAWGRLIDDLKDAEAISAAAEKLVRCKGRYHSELNYRALAALFGVSAPDLPPLEGEQEPVADVVAWHKEGEERTCDIRWRRHDVEPGPLYAVPQSAVTYPQKLPCPVRLEPGLLFGKGVTTSTMLAALQRREEYYAELEAMTPEERVKHDASIEEFKAMLPQGDMPLSVRANGEANSYTLLKDGNWFANILMNGEMTVPQHWDFLNSITKEQ